MNKPTKAMPAPEISAAAHDLIYLISCALNDTAPDKARCEAMDLDKVFAAARLHNLASCAASALERAVELPRPFDQAKKKAIRKLSLFEIERAVIFRELEKAGIWYLPLKGIILGAYYPRSAMREMSDNDILCDPDRMDDLKEIMERHGYKCDHFGKYNHDVYSKPPTLEFELHHSLFADDYSPKVYSYFLNIKDRLIRKSDFEYSMTDEDFYLFLLAHMHKHFINCGTGIRSLADLYVYLRRDGDSLDRAYIDPVLEKLGLADFERSARSLAFKTFEQQPLDENEKKELCYLIFSGSYGTNENLEYNNLSRRLNGDDSKSSKRDYYIRRIFIRGEDLERNYPFFARHRILYPALFVYRLFKAAFIKPASILAERRKVESFHLR